MSDLANNLQNLLDQLLENKNQQSQVDSKIIIQKSEINKTLSFIEKFNQCLQQQNEMLSKLETDKLKMISRKKEIIKDIKCLEEDTDNSQHEINIPKVGTFGQVNMSDKIQPKRTLEVSNLSVGCKKIKIDENRVRKNDGKINETNSLQSCLTINYIFPYNKFVYVCGSEGYLAEYMDYSHNYKIINTGTTKDILSVIIGLKYIYAFSENQLIRIDKQNTNLKPIIHQFSSKIIFDINNDGNNLIVALENGTVWLYNWNTANCTMKLDLRMRVQYFIYFKRNWKIFHSIEGQVYSVDCENIKTPIYKLQNCLQIQRLNKRQFVAIFKEKILVFLGKKFTELLQLKVSCTAKLVSCNGLIMAILDTENRVRVVQNIYSKHYSMKILDFNNVSTISRLKDNKIYLAIGSKINVIEI